MTGLYLGSRNEKIVFCTTGLWRAPSRLYRGRFSRRALALKVASLSSDRMNFFGDRGFWDIFGTREFAQRGKRVPKATNAGLVSC